MTRRTVRRTPAPMRVLSRLGGAVLSAFIMGAVLFAGAAPARADVDAVARGLAVNAKASIPGSLSGNALTNFVNPARQHSAGAVVTSGGHKTILFVGNSIVWKATSYFAEWCNVLGASNKLTQIGLTACSTPTSYTVNNTTGSITVTFSGSAPSGYAVGDLILSAPTNAGLGTLLGTGVITAIGASSFTYQLLAINPFPSSTGTTSSGGYVTNSLANLGFNGAASTAINTTVAPLLGTYAKPGDLVLVNGPLVNDTRLNACDLACATANVTSLYKGISQAIPATTDIGWKTENSLLTTDPTSSGLVSPLGSSAAFTKINHDAVVQALSALPPRVVFWDSMQLVYTSLGYEFATSTWMSDILHPATLGQQREAKADGQVLASFAAGRGFATLTMQDPYLGAPASGVSTMAGNKSWIQNLQALVGFSTYKEEHALADNYASPWSLYPDAVLDTERYDVLAYGIVSSSGTTFVRISYPEVNGATPAEVIGGDLIWFQGSGVIQVPSGVSRSTINLGGSVYGLSLASLGSIVPASVYFGQPVVVVRPHSFVAGDTPYYANPVTYPYRHFVNVPAAGTNFIRVSFNDSTVSWPNALATTDVLALPCGLIPLTGATFTISSTYTQIGLTGSWAACAAQNGYVYGTHAMEVSGALVVSTGPLKAAVTTFSALPSCAAGTEGEIENVSDSTVVASGNYGAAVTGGGANHVKVYCDGTSWKIGQLTRPANDNWPADPLLMALG